MKRYIHTKASTNILTYTNKHFHRHTHKNTHKARALRCRLSHSSHAWPFFHTQNLVQTVGQSDNTDTFRRVKGRQRGQTEQRVQRRN